jgi:hypothetical protein
VIDAALSPSRGGASATCHHRIRRNQMSISGIDGIGSADRSGINASRSIEQMRSQDIESEQDGRDSLSKWNSDFDKNTAKAAGECNGKDGSKGADSSKGAEGAGGGGIEGLLKRLIELLEQVLPMLKELAGKQSGANPTATNAANGLGNPPGSPLGSEGDNSNNPQSPLGKLGDSFIEKGNALDRTNSAIKSANPQAFPETETSTDADADSDAESSEQL